MIEKFWIIFTKLFEGLGLSLLVGCENSKKRPKSTSAINRAINKKEDNSDLGSSFINRQCSQCFRDFTRRPLVEFPPADSRSPEELLLILLIIETIPPPLLTNIVVIIIIISSSSIIFIETILVLRLLTWILYFRHLYQFSATYGARHWTLKGSVRKNDEMFF